MQLIAGEMMSHLVAWNQIKHSLSWFKRQDPYDR
jgi:hypothetical protein